MAMRMRSSLAPGGACPLALMAWKAGSTKSASKSSEMVASGLGFGGRLGWCVCVWSKRVVQAKRGSIH